MKRKQYLHGLMGLLSLLGWIGIFTEERAFLAFFAFAVDFQYFFLPSDEMLEAYTNRSASLAFYCGMVATAAAALIGFFAMEKTGAQALLLGFTCGWVIAVLVHAIGNVYYGFRESWGMSHDSK